MTQPSEPTTEARAMEVERYKAIGHAIGKAWNSEACSAQLLPPIDLYDSEAVFLGKAASDAILALGTAR